MIGRGRVFVRLIGRAHHVVTAARFDEAGLGEERGREDRQTDETTFGHAPCVSRAIGEGNPQSGSGRNMRGDGGASCPEERAGDHVGRIVEREEHA